MAITEWLQRHFSAQQIMLFAWVGVGMVPFLLQTRSYFQFVSPHKISESLVPPPGSERLTANLTELCPVEGFRMGLVWWNVAPTHYYPVERGQICHVVVPQYNLHGSYYIGASKVKPFHTAPSSCADDSYSFRQYLYHGSFGYYAFYEEAKGTYCANDNTAYATVGGLGTYDINGYFLAQDSGLDGYRWSYWYGIAGFIWLVYRALVLRRSFVLCKRYGRRCDAMGEKIHHNAAIVLVHENMRLSAHGARNYHRAALLYLLIEGLMSDLFLLIAYEGIYSQIQYISIGYNLSGVILLVWEIIESMKWLGEKSRMFVKRIIFSYESSLLGEFLTAAIQQHTLIALNRSNLKNSRPQALAVSYYVWSFLWHTIFVLCLITFILGVRVLWAVTFVLLKNRTLTVFFKPCCVDETLGARCRMTLLSSYRWENGSLYYEQDSLKAFGMFKKTGPNSLRLTNCIGLPRRETTWLCSGPSQTRRWNHALSDHVLGR